MRPMSKVKVHGHHTISFESMEKIEWHLANLWDGGYKTVIDMPKHKHIKLHAKRNRKKKAKTLGKPIYFGRVIIGHMRGVG